MHTQTKHRGIIVISWLMALIVALARIGTSPVHAQGGVIYVDRDANAGGDGTSWDSAYRYLRDALDYTNTYSSTNYEIWVAEGVYYPDGGASAAADSRVMSFTLRYNNVQLYGGFDPQSGDDEWGERDWVAHLTTLSGDIDENDANADGNDIAEVYSDIFGNNAYHVLYLDGENNEPITETTIIDGFTITAGQGGALYCAGSGSGNECSPVLTNVTFSGNQAGGGMYNNGSAGGVSSPVLTNVTFSGNQAGDGGGGMFNASHHAGFSSPVLTNVIFNGNQAGWGGGMFNYAWWGGISSPTLTNVIFSGNHAHYEGGGMFNYGDSGNSSPLLTNVTFSGNYAKWGGGMYNNGDGGISSPALTNVILWGNEASTSGNQLYNSEATPVLSYTLIQSDTSDIYNTGVTTVTYGIGILTSDPQFVAPILATAAPATAGNYRLQAASPAIDAGHNGAVKVDSDLDDEPRIQCTTVDLGAYEYAPYVHLTKRVTFSVAGQVMYTIAFHNPLTTREPVTEVMINDSMPGSVISSTFKGSSGVIITPTGAAPDFAWAVQPLAPGAGGVITVSGVLSPDLDRPSDVVNTAIITGENIRTGVATATFRIPGLLYVDQDATGAATGLSWTDAFTNLQDALAFTDEGDEIWVAEGVHYPDVGGGQVDNDRTATFRIPDNIALYGGFAGTETSRDQRDWETHVTILSGDIDANDWNTDTNAIAETWDDIVGENAYHVLWLDGETNAPITRTTVINGFTITAGQARTKNLDTIHDNGGGMYCAGNGRDNECSPTISNVTFSGNWGYYGGGMFNDGSSSGTSNPMLVDVAFSGNHAKDGGGVFNNGSGGVSSPSLTKVTFSDNQAYDFGGGMCNDGADGGVSSPTLNDVTFSNNFAENAGGGMYNNGTNAGTSSPILTDVTLSSNKSSMGGGIHNEVMDGGSSSPILTNVTFSENIASWMGGGMYGGMPTLIDVTFGSNQADFGGGICGGKSRLTNVTFSGNQANFFGGGMYSDDAELVNVTFRNNWAGYSGGGMYNASITSTLAHVIFVGNQAEYGGGGMFNESSTLALMNVIFAGNQAVVGGGGIYNEYSALSLSNVTFAGNQTSGSGAGIYNEFSNPKLTNCIFWGNRAADAGDQIYNTLSRPTLDYSLVEGGCPPYAVCDAHLLTHDPRFVAPIAASNAPTTAGDYRLQFGSPAINAGNVWAVTPITTDLDGQPRVQDCVVDLGAYEIAATEDGSCPVIHKAVTPTIALPGERITYTLTFSNVATADALTATGVVISDSLPVSVTKSVFVGNRGVLITSTGTAPDFAWTVAPLAPGAGGMITISGVLDAALVGPGDIINTAIITGENANPAANIGGRASFHIPSTNPRLLYVDQDAVGAATGLSWTDAFTNLQDALLFAERGGEVWVAEGVYYPDVGRGDNDRSTTFWIREDIGLYGGFAGIETAREQRDWNAHVTVLSGDIDGNDWNTDTNSIAETWNDLVGDNAYHVLYLGGETHGPITRDTVIDGFTITAGQAKNSSYSYSFIESHRMGGGIYCDGEGSSNVCNPTLANIVFSGNQANQYGGGLFNDGSNGGNSSPSLTNITFIGNYTRDYGGGMFNGEGSPVLTHVIFTSNQAGHGGGMVSTGGDPRLTDVTFTDNQVDSSGGGMFIYKSNPILNRVKFIGNRSEYEGGGMCNYSPPVSMTDVAFIGNLAGSIGGGMCNLFGGVSTLTNFIFVGNQAELGGGMYNGYETSVHLINVTFANNQADNKGGAIFSDESDFSLTNSILWGNRAGVSDQIYITNTHTTYRYNLNHTLIEGGCPISATCDAHVLTADPRFIAPVGATAAPTSTGNYRLQAGSPAIDAGNSLSVTVATDLDGHPRIYGAAVDLGAYESQPILALRKRVTPTHDVAYHGEVTYTLTLSNTGILSETNGYVTDALPAEVDFARWIVSPTNTTVVSDTLRWHGPISPGHGLTWTFSAVHVGRYGDTLTNTAQVSGTQYTGTATASASIVANGAPVADAGRDQTVIPGVRVTLDGSGSRDPEGHALTYGWRVSATDGGGATLSDAASVAPTFSAPRAVGRITFTLVVTDAYGMADATPDEVIIRVVPGEAFIPIDPGMGGELVYTTTRAGGPVTTTLTLPDGAVTEALTFVYNALAAATHALPNGLSFAGHAFTLNAYRGVDEQAPYTFVRPITIAIMYTDEDIHNLDEGTLQLYAWDGQAWLDDGIALVRHAIDRNVMVFAVAHLTEFVLVGENLPATLHVIKSVDTGGVDPVPLDHAITYTLAIRNNGAGIAFGVVVTDPLPAALSTVGWITGSVLLPSPTRVITWGPWDIPARTAYSVVFTATVTDAAYAGQTITNTAYFSAANHAPGTSNPVTVAVAPAAVNRAPRFLSTPPPTATVGITYTYAITTFDPDRDALTVTATTKPGWLTLTDRGDGNAVLRGIPPLAERYEVTLRVSDGALSATQAFSITVLDEPPPLNTPPTISDIANQVTVMDTPISVTFTISDAETSPDCLALRKASDNTLLVPQANSVFGGSGINRTATITPATGMTGTAVITFTVSDGELSSYDCFVLDVNIPPDVVYPVYLPIVMRQ